MVINESLNILEVGRKEAEKESERINMPPADRWGNRCGPLST